MHNIAVDYIERYIRFPDTLDPDEIEHIERAIDGSDELKRLVNFFHDYYLELDQIERTGTNENPTVIPLLPIRIKTQPDPSTNRIVLAANTHSEDNHNLKTIATMVSGDNSTLLRILKDRSEDLIRIHLLSQLVSSDDFSILSLSSLDTDLVIAKSGKLSLKDEGKFQHHEWEKEPLMLRIPTIRGLVNLKRYSQENPVQQIAEDHIEGPIPVERVKDALLVNLKKRSHLENTYTRILASGDKTGTSLILINSSAPRIPVKTSDHSISLWFFQ